MQYEIKEVDKNDVYWFEWIAKWDSDPAIKPFVMPRMTEAELVDFTPEELMNSAKKSRDKLIYMLLIENKPVGTTTLDMNFHMLKSPNKHTGWVSICIGDKSFWGQGLSKIMMQHLEETAKEHGIEYLELGVFEFNTRAMHLYKSMGYEVIEEIEHFTFHENQWYKDIRMLKKL